MSRARPDTWSAPAIVGVILSRADLRRVVGMRRTPDLVELRLDALALQLGDIEDELQKLKSPLILTARHSAEGGLNQLRPRERRSLLLRFLPHAAYVDIELRSARTLATVLEEARARNIGAIISFHDFYGTPNAARFEKIAQAAWALKPDFLKVVTRTDNPAQMARLRDFLFRHRKKRRVAVMGMGQLGRRVRLEFAVSGSALNYAPLGGAQVEGQLSIKELRQIIAKESFPFRVCPK